MANAESPALPLTLPGRTFADVDEMTEHLAGWDVEFTQLAAGQVVGSHTMARIGSTLIQGGRTLVPLIQRGAAPPQATFSILASPDIRLISRGRDHGGDRILINHPGDEIHWRTGPDFRVRTLSVNEEHLRQVARELDVERGLGVALRVHSVRPSPKLLTTLRRAVFDEVETRRVGSSTDTHSAPSSAVVEQRTLRLLARALASHTGSEKPEQPRRLDAVMLEVQAVLNEYPERAFTREELSNAVGVSDRSIRRAAQAWCETSPLNLVKVRRLHAARRDLRRADPRSGRVIHVATRWGFTHMSRFAGEYSALFGERPSDTLRGACPPRGGSHQRAPTRHPERYQHQREIR